VTPETATLLAFSAAVAVSTMLTRVVRALAVRFDLLDHAISARKIHGQAVPRLGGVAIVAGSLASIFTTRWFGQPVAASQTLNGFIACSLGIALLGVVDDLRGANAWQKFAVELAAAGTAFAYGIRIESLVNPFGPPVVLGPFSLPFTLLWIVGVTNAFNLIDGLDGLAAGVALIALSVNFLLAFSRGEVATTIVCAALAGATLGFLRYNFHPASIFMGDTGSLFLGFALATLAVESHQKSTTAVAILVPITAMGLPLLDTGLAMIRRVAGGKHVFQADREHIHHRLLAMGLTHRRAVWALYAISASFGLVALALNYADRTATLVLGMSLLVGVAFLLARLGYLGAGWQRGHGPASQAEAIERIRAGMTAYRPHDVWEALRNASAALDADGVRLQLVDRGSDGETVTRTYEAGQGPASGDGFVIRLKLRADGRERGWVEFGWMQSTPRLAPETDEALRLLCEDVSGAHVRQGDDERPAKVLALRRR
jgi:UDP-GlcNAc:undecaprenyl-phosphate/decaprenyl-phosphate GlcNAc-1-phosphate transferase